MKRLLLIVVSILSFNSFGQQEIDYMLKIQNFEELEYKFTLGQISELFAPCSTTHLSDGTLIFKTEHPVDTVYINNELELLGLVPTSFDIINNSINDPLAPSLSEKSINTDCSNSVQICSNSSFTGNSNGIGSQELNLVNHGCLIDDERQSSWYYLYVGVSGTLGMTITPSNGSDDYDFAIWGPFTPGNLLANCAPMSPPIRCNFTSYPDWFPGGPWSCGTLTNPTGMQVNALLPTESDACTDEPFSRHLDVLAGEVYIMIIDNWSTSLDPFDISWNGTGVLDCTPIPLPTELVEFQVESINGKNQISWTTISERDNDYFEIQLRSDHKDWTAIRVIDGAGTSNYPLKYSYSDESYSPVINYYRIKQVDFNGTVTFHSVISSDNRMEKEKIRSCTNILGQEVDFDAKCLKIIIYYDGTKLFVSP